MLSQDVVRRLTVVANEQGLTSLNTKLGQTSRTYDQITAGSTRAAAATEAAHQRMGRTVAAFNRGGLGGVGLMAGGAVVSSVAPILAGVTAVTAAYVALNMVFERGSELIEKYANAQRELDRPDLKENLSSLTVLQQDTISAAQVQRATELGMRMQDAKFEIEQFFKVHLDITDSALKLQGAWVRIVELIGMAASRGGGVIAATGQAAATAGIGAVPGGGALLLANRAYDYFNPPPAAPTREQELAAARSRLGAAMGVRNIENGGPLGDSFSARFGASIYGLANPERPEKPTAAAAARRDEFDRVTDSIRKQTEALNIQVETFGMSTAEAARYKVEQQLLNAATAAGRELTDEQRASIAATAVGYAQATAALEQMRKAQELANEVSMAFRDGLKGFVSDIVTGLREGAEFWDVFAEAGTKALQRISDKLIDMAMNQLWEQAFPSKGGGAGFLASLFGGGGGAGAAAGSSYMMGGVSVPLFHAGGIVGQSAVAHRMVHPAYFENAPRFHNGGEVPALLMPGEEVLTRSNPRHSRNGGGGAVYQDNRVFQIDARGATPDAIAVLNRKIDSLRQESPQIALAAVSEANRKRPSVTRPR